MEQIVEKEKNGQNNIAQIILFVMIFLLYFTVGWGKWNDHVLGWWKHKDDPNVLFLKYEDLQKVCCGFTCRI